MNDWLDGVMNGWMEEWIGEEMNELAYLLA